MPSPAVSVVVPTYRRSDLLVRAIRSVLGQTLDAVEIIIVDDNGAGDPHRERTLERLRPFLSDPRIHHLAHDQNRGGSAARNTGIHAARAEYVAFLDDDDVWHPEKLALQLEAFQRFDANVALVCTSCVRIEESTGTRRIVRPRLVEPLMPALLMNNVVGPTSTIVCRRDALIAVGGFDETLPAMQDIDLYVRLADRYRMVAIDRPLVDYHSHDAGNIGANPARVAAARRIFAAKHQKRIEADPKILRYRLENDAMVFLAADQPAEALTRLGAVLRSAPHRIDLLAWYVAATFGLHLQATRARFLLGAGKRAVIRWVRNRRARPSVSEQTESWRCSDPDIDQGVRPRKEITPNDARPNESGGR